MRLRINNEKELYAAWLGVYLGEQMKNKSPMLEKEIRKRKIAIRYWNHIHEEPAEEKILNDDYNGYDGIVTCPDWITTEDGAIGYYYTHYYSEFRPSAYDCTGSKETTLQKVFKRNGRWVVWYSAVFDV